MDAATLVLFNGVTGAVADVALNDLSRVNDFVKLRPYFARRGILSAAGAAGLTVAIGAATVLVATHFAVGYTVPLRGYEWGITLVASFVVGWFMDVAIRRLRVFADLEAYYAAHGAGLWGGASLAVSMAISLAMQALVLPHLR